MADLIYPDGTHQTVTPEDGTHFTLDELQEYVGGYIERAPYPKDEDCDVIVNEEGLLKQLEDNPTGTALLKTVEGVEPRLVGPVLVLRGKERLQ